MAKQVNPVGLTLKEYLLKVKETKVIPLMTRDNHVTGVRVTNIVFNFKKVKADDPFLKELGSSTITIGSDGESYFLNTNGRSEGKAFAI